METPATVPRSQVSSQEAVRELEQRVQRRLQGRVRDFRLIVQDNGVVLCGYAHTYYAKQLAQTAVLEETELLIVANNIEVS